jgi:hypothetical protein
MKSRVAKRATLKIRVGRKISRKISLLRVLQEVINSVY